MKNQYTKFYAKLPLDFKEQMIAFWMEDERSTREEVERSYAQSRGFKKLCEKLGEVLIFKPDLGYADPNINVTLCFELLDNDYPIPVYILEDTKGTELTPSPDLMSYIIRNMPQLSQRQDALDDQLRDLRLVANRLGMYDAADFIKNYE